ncbi:hypothetical protein Vadar_008272 [Vaccinium darrowii]|uniref:Uncharacterized protein n=1 Tax=Vaccinium darrowii TaxID=229202 RepID=A0ACB7ZHR8_9ERIC|nr:hypothetical protein Vadar_008272 [Vaccinium darrowii]
MVGNRRHSVKETIFDESYKSQNRKWKDRNVTLFIGNLPEDMDAEWLFQLFTPAGKVVDTFIPYKRSYFDNARYGFVRFTSMEEGLNAISLINGMHIRGHKILVKFARFSNSNFGDFNKKMKMPPAHDPKLQWRPKNPISHESNNVKKILKPIKVVDVGNEWLRRSVVAKLAQDRSMALFSEYLCNLGHANIEVKPMGKKGGEMHFDSNDFVAETSSNRVEGVEESLEVKTSPPKTVVNNLALIALNDRNLASFIDPAIVAGVDSSKQLLQLDLDDGKANAVNGNVMVSKADQKNLDDAKSNGMNYAEKVQDAEVVDESPEANKDEVETNLQMVVYNPPCKSWKCVLQRQNMLGNLMIGSPNIMPLFPIEEQNSNRNSSINSATDVESSKIVSSKANNQLIDNQEEDQLSSWSEDCIKVIEDSWRINQNHRRNAMRLCMKLKELKAILKTWAKDVLGNTQKRLEEVELELHKLDIQAEEGNSSESIVALKKTLKEELWKLNRAIESMWLQKSRINWQLLGDKNTKFFHFMASARQRKNLLSSLSVNGTLTEDPDQIKLAIFSHFQNLFVEFVAMRPSILEKTWVDQLILLLATN